MIWFGWFWNIIGNLMPNPLYAYILNIFDLVGLGFMAFR